MLKTFATSLYPSKKSLLIKRVPNQAAITNVTLKHHKPSFNSLENLFLQSMKTAIKKYIIANMNEIL